MTVREILSLLHAVVENGGIDYLLLLEDEDEEIYTFTGVEVDSEHESVLLQVDTRPMELR